MLPVNDVLAMLPDLLLLRLINHQGRTDDLADDILQDIGCSHSAEQIVKAVVCWGRPGRLALQGERSSDDVESFCSKSPLEHLSQWAWPSWSFGDGRAVFSYDWPRCDQHIIRLVGLWLLGRKVAVDIEARCVTRGLKSMLARQYHTDDELT